MKVIFLDVDGVLNSQQFLVKTRPDREAANKKDIDRVTWWSMMLDPEPIKVLNSIIEKTGAKVVLSSSWRNVHELPDMVAFLKAKGFVGELIDKTPKRASIAPFRRGNEIQAWLTDHPEVERFVILDDDSDMEHLMPKLVHTSWLDGLTEKYTEEILKHLL